jgi:SAM-dependent methyltransferase
MSAIALIESGARAVVGVEPDPERADVGRQRVAALGLTSHVTIEHVPDTGALPFADAAFPFILANGVFEHIPSPRRRYLAEVWRVLRSGGHLLIRETPNPYWPKEIHTTGLWFNHWLPERVAHRRAVRRGRFRAERDDWASSGWRGMSYHEMIRALPGAVLVTPHTRWRHRLLAAIGLPSQLLDPAPVWLLRRDPEMRAGSKST